MRWLPDPSGSPLAFEPWVSCRPWLAPITPGFPSLGSPSAAGLPVNSGLSPHSCGFPVGVGSPRLSVLGFLALLARLSPLNLGVPFQLDPYLPAVSMPILISQTLQLASVSPGFVARLSCLGFLTLLARLASMGFLIPLARLSAMGFLNWLARLTSLDFLLQLARLLCLGFLQRLARLLDLGFLRLVARLSRLGFLLPTARLLSLGFLNSVARL